ncbi:unnamed protein product [Orchesella dallaii]|uniref:Uncharacterized protein n=1 Tax=Orchesella dallaii TaxID=48710 RepID=A0ABP1RWL3_9HEXA
MLCFLNYLERDPKLVALWKQVSECNDLSKTYFSIYERQITSLLGCPSMIERYKQISRKYIDLMYLCGHSTDPVTDSIRLVSNLKTETEAFADFKESDDNDAVEFSQEMDMEKLRQFALAFADKRFQSAALIDYDKMTKEWEDLNLISKFRECIAEILMWSQCDLSSRYFRGTGRDQHEKASQSSSTPTMFKWGIVMSNELKDFRCQYSSPIKILPSGKWQKVEYLFKFGNNARNLKELKGLRQIFLIIEVHKEDPSTPDEIQRDLLNVKFARACVTLELLDNEPDESSSSQESDGP